jgi:LuxR family transcriptional regulator, maltose regulon positive regulatory protein
VRSLLIFLAINGRSHREQVLDALWPHLDPTAADRNLRVTLTYLHQVLEADRRSGEAPFFARQDCSTLFLAGAPHFQLDASEFDALADRAEDADRRGLPSVALQLFEEAIALWRGPCLREVVYEEWAQSMCTRLTARFVTAALRAGELCLAAERAGAARIYATRALEADEWCEPAHRILIGAALASSDRSGALRAFAQCDAMLAGLGIGADAETEVLRRRLLVPSAPAVRRAEFGAIGLQPTMEHEHAIV